MDVEKSVEEILVDFRKSLQADGGNIKLVEVTDGVAKVRLTRTEVPVTFSTFLRTYKTREVISCGRCRVPSSTIIKVLESLLKEKIPGIIKVETIK